jgi:hypothetical protein
MIDRAEQQIARMLTRGALDQAEARAAMRLVSIAESALGTAEAPANAFSEGPAGVFLGRRRSINRRERQLVGRIADRHLFGRWLTEMRGSGHDPDITIAVLLLGQALSALDRRGKRRKGWACSEVRQGVRIFQRLVENRDCDDGLDKAGQRRYQIG